MNRIERMLQELCPEGVEYLSLGECIEIYTGIQFNKRDMSEVGTYPVLNGGINPSGFTEKYNEEKDTITISQGGASAGYVNWMDCKFWAGAHCFVVKPNNNILNNRYLYFLLKNSEQILMQAKHGAGIPGLNRDKVKNLIIPVPPLPIQDEIVRILDHFTELTAVLQAELNAELQARQEQYEYYRNKLLTFDDDIPKMKLNDIVTFMNGKGHEKYIEDKGTYIVVNSKYISSNGTVIKYSNSQISPVYEGMILMVMSDLPKGKALARCFVVDADNKYTLNQRIGAFTIKDKSLITTRFLYYILDRNNQLLSYDNGVDQTNLRKWDILNILIPILPLPDQQRIVAILDKFESLVNDLSQGLPAEIAAVQEQYEYYRNKLLTFKRIA